MIASVLIRPRNFCWSSGGLTLDAIMIRGRAPAHVITAILFDGAAHRLEIELLGDRGGRYHSGRRTHVTMPGFLQLNGHWMHQTGPVAGRGRRWVFAARDWVRRMRHDEFEPGPGNALSGHDWVCLAALGLDTLPPAEDLLKRAWRRRLREVHPDMGGCAEETLKVIDAYEVLRRRFREAA
jgi:hypothetical protein